MQDLVGSQLDKYHIKSLLGKGGMGSVYLAEDMNLHRQVAIKVINTTLANESQFLSRFKQEAQTAANLDHPSIIRIWEFDNKNGLLYMVMEYVPKGSLVAYLEQQQRKGTQIPLEETLHLMAQVADALGYAHQQGIVHRDVKPDNVLLKELRRPNRDGEPPLQAVVTDFGLVKLQEGGVQTEAKMLMGTLPYISPEQLQARKLDGRSDLYSLGVVLYELATGRLPYNIRTIQDAVKYHLHSAPVSPKSIRPDIPADVEQIILKAVAKDIHARYQTGEEIAANLRRALGNLMRGAATHLAAAPEVKPASSIKPASRPPERSAPVPDPAQSPSADQLTLQRPGESPRSQPLSKSVITIGRSSSNDIVLKEDSVSSKHARLERTATGWQVTDLKSTNGTFIEDNELKPNVPYPWSAGDRLHIEPYVFTWQRATQAEQPTPPVQARPAPPPITPQPPPQPVYTPPPPPAQVVAPAPPPSLVETADGEMNLGSITLSPMTVSVAPGSQVTIQVQVINESSLVDHFSVRIEGLPAEWVTFSDDQPRLMPGRETGLWFTINPPNRSTSAAKTYPYRLVLRSVSNARLEGNAFGNIILQPFHRYSADVDPKAIQNTGHLRVRIRNESNTDEQFTIVGKELNALAAFDKVTQRITISSGQEGDVRFKVEAANRPWRGNGRNAQVEFQVSTPAGSPQNQSAQLEITPRIPNWLFTLLFAMGVAIPALTMWTIINFIRSANQEAQDLAISLTATSAAMTAEAATASSVLATETSVAATVMYVELDNDGDGLTNGEEAALGTRLDILDTDGDGLNDGEEVNIWNTIPTDRDSDDDTLSDGEEAATNGCLSPTNADSDGDQVIDNVDTAGCTLPTFTPTPTATPTATPLPGINILPSSASSFEGPYRQWIRQDGVVVDNLRVPVGWQMLVADNYPNTLDPHTGDFFYRPESGPIRNDQLPESEQGLYVFEGDSAMKIFKDDSPIFFTMYRDQELDAGVYLFSIELFADSVVTYRPTKQYASDPLAAEVQLCIEGGAQYPHRDWESVPAGQRVKMELLFVIPSFNVVRIYASFRNRFQYSNNGWFFDNWWLYKVAEYDQAQELPAEHVCDRPR